MTGMLKNKKSSFCKPSVTVATRKTCHPSKATTLAQFHKCLRPRIVVILLSEMSQR